jgi:cytochrome P450 family 4
MKKMYDILTRFEFLYQFTDLYKKEQKLLKLLHDFTENVIQSRREELLKISEKIEEVDQKKKKALLDILLTSTIDGVPLTNEDIREEVDTFLFAGHDTTTSALSFIFYNIAKYPEVQQKVYEEIMTCIDTDGKFTQSQLNNLHYTELVIKESLRLFPSVPMYGRKLKEEITIEGYTFPKDCNVYFSSWGMGHSPKYFEDPDEFKPERFDVETSYEKINPFAYVPFSAGKI